MRSVRWLEAHVVVDHHTEPLFVTRVSDRLGVGWWVTRRGRYISGPYPSREDAHGAAERLTY